MYQYYRIAAAVPDMRVADTAYNVDQMLQKVEEAKQKGRKEGKKRKERKS